VYYSILADIVVLIHLGFVVFAVLGAVLILWRRWVVWLHLPAAGWAIWIELSGGICPLTPLENWLRIKAEQGAYEADFVSTYLLPMLYPPGLTPRVRYILAMLVIVINVAGYVILLYKHNQR
jgi:hypothetical protein